jgi:hypothetical protein
MNMDAHGPGRRSLGLGDGFLDELGTVSHPAEEDAVNRKIQGPQFQVGFHEKAVTLTGNKMVP